MPNITLLLLLHLLLLLLLLPLLQDGMDDESYESLFRPIMDTIMANYQPDAIVLQSGTENICSIFFLALRQCIPVSQEVCELRLQSPSSCQSCLL